MGGIGALGGAENAIANLEMAALAGCCRDSKDSARELSASNPGQRRLVLVFALDLE